MCAQYEFNTDSYWECNVRAVASTMHHSTCTCKMGNSTDPGAVVTPELKVIGINNLRVADTSILPTPGTSHTAAPAMMIGEKLATLLLP